MSSEIGRKRWAIAEGYIPTYSHATGPDLLSHEAVCILNASDQEAHVKIIIFFTDREPVGPFLETIPARRTKHIRFNDLKDPEEIPKGVDYASIVESDVNIVVQHTRLDSRQAANTIMTTIAYSSDA